LLQGKTLTLADDCNVSTADLKGVALARLLCATVSQLSICRPPIGDVRAKSRADRRTAVIRPSKGVAMLKIETLLAGHGDCLWIEYGDPQAPRRVLIDGGATGTYKRALQPKLRALPENDRRF